MSTRIREPDLHAVHGGELSSFASRPSFSLVVRRRPDPHLLLPSAHHSTRPPLLSSLAPRYHRKVTETPSAGVGFVRRFSVPQSRVSSTPRHRVSLRTRSPTDFALLPASSHLTSIRLTWPIVAAGFCLSGQEDRLLARRALVELESVFPSPLPAPWFLLESFTNSRLIPLFAHSQEFQPLRCSHG